MKPMPVSDVLIAFPGDVAHLMPPRGEIPSEYYDFHNRSWGRELFETMFFKGVTRLDLLPREGVDPELAFRHISAVMRTFSCKHEDKAAVCAYLFELWFEKAEWEGRS